MKKPNDMKIVKRVTKAGVTLLLAVFTTLAYVPDAALVYAAPSGEAASDEADSDGNADEEAGSDADSDSDADADAESHDADAADTDGDDGIDDSGVSDDGAADDDDADSAQDDATATDDQDADEDSDVEEVEAEQDAEEAQDEEEDTEEEAEIEEVVEAEPVYEGITIDGDFSDWAAVVKTDAGGSTEYQDFLEAVAMFVDGDYAYVYIRDTGLGAAAWSGPHGNGQFSLVSDLGYSVLFQVHSNGQVGSATVTGVDHATAAYYTAGWPHSGEWEIAIPVDQLPTNTGTFSFGYYQAEPFIADIADTSGVNAPKSTSSSSDDADDKGAGSGSGSFSGIVYDGLYGDWTYYPHTLIQYATSGTAERFVDGEGALYVQGDKLFGHVYTKMAAHLTEHGDEMTYGVVLRINQNDQYWFEFRLVEIGRDGSVNWNPSVSGAPNGSYEYAIVDTRGWSGAETLDALNDENFGNQIYGYITITKGEISDEAEWWLDLPMIADHFGLEETDMKVLEVMYERIGYKWIQTAGASSGPVAGILLSMATAGGVVLYRRRKSKQIF